jgi:hypothetical protein
MILSLPCPRLCPRRGDRKNVVSPRAYIRVPPCPLSFLSKEYQETFAPLLSPLVRGGQRGQPAKSNGRKESNATRNRHGWSENWQPDGAPQGRIDSKCEAGGHVVVPLRLRQFSPHKWTRASKQGIAARVRSLHL